MSVLIMAVIMGHATVVDHLLNHGVDVNRKGGVSQVLRMFVLQIESSFDLSVWFLGWHDCIDVRCDRGSRSHSRAVVET